MRKQWGKFPNWVGFCGARSGKGLTVSLAEFLVYWSHGDINRKAREITYGVIQRVSQAGFGQHLGVVSQVAANVASPLHDAVSKVTTGAASVTSSLISGRPIYYQHLLSARNARNALEGHSNGITLSTVRVALSCMGDHLRILAAALPS